MSVVRACNISILNVNKHIILSKHNKTAVIKDPLGQTHKEHCFLLFCFSRFEKWGRMYGRTCAKTMIPTGRDFGLAEWINKVQVTVYILKFHYQLKQNMCSKIEIGNSSWRIFCLSKLLSKFHSCCHWYLQEVFIPI